MMYSLMYRSKHVPYRSHVLTTLMSDSLGGNAKTLMFVNVSPSAYNADETVNGTPLPACCVKELTMLTYLISS